MPGAPAAPAAPVAPVGPVGPTAPIDPGSLPRALSTGICPAFGRRDAERPFSAPAFFAKSATLANGTAFVTAEPAAWPSGVQPSSAIASVAVQRAVCSLLFI